MGGANYERAAIFIDGGYLNKVLQHFKNINLEYQRFSDKICSYLKLDRLRTYYYNCLPLIIKDDELDKQRYDKSKNFHNNLSRLSRFEVKFGELQIIKGVFKQKGIDILMSLDIVNKCFEKQIQHVILIAGDADFIPAIKKAKDYGAIVHLFCHKKAVNQILLNEVDEIHYITREFLEDCKIEDSKDERKI